MCREHLGSQWRKFSGILYWIFLLTSAEQNQIRLMSANFELAPMIGYTYIPCLFFILIAVVMLRIIAGPLDPDDTLKMAVQKTP